jgi:hypothetical protein
VEILVGLCLAIAISVFATLSGFDRDRVFYPTILFVVATYYALFAVMGGSREALLIECGFVALFVAASVVAFKWSLWVAVAGLLGHTVFDFLHPHLVNNAGMPSYWPGFCGTYDAVAAAYLAFLLMRRKSKI